MQGTPPRFSVLSSVLLWQNFHYLFQPENGSQHPYCFGLTQVTRKGLLVVFVFLVSVTRFISTGLLCHYGFTLKHPSVDASCIMKMVLQYQHMYMTQYYDLPQSNNFNFLCLSGQMNLNGLPCNWLFGFTPHLESPDCGYTSESPQYTKSAFAYDWS